MKTIKTTSVELIIEEGVVQGFYYREGTDVKMYIAKRANTEDIGRFLGKKVEDSITITPIGGETKSHITLLSHDMVGKNNIAEIGGIELCAK